MNTKDKLKVQIATVYASIDLMKDSLKDNVEKYLKEEYKKIKKKQPKLKRVRIINDKKNDPRVFLNYRDTSWGLVIEPELQKEWENIWGDDSYWDGDDFHDWVDNERLSCCPEIEYNHEIDTDLIDMVITDYAYDIIVTDNCFELKKNRIKKERGI